MVDQIKDKLQLLYKLQNINFRNQKLIYLL